MKIIKKISNLDNSEKDFLLLLLAFFLVATFLFVGGFFNNDEQDNISSRIYLGFSEDDIDSIEINIFQNLTCKFANMYNSCNKVDETYVITSNICCKKLGKCC